MSRHQLAPCVALFLALLLPHGVAAAPRSIPLIEGRASTLYVEATVEGVGSRRFLVDTGSTYSAVAGHTIERLREQGRARFVRHARGTLADGSRRRVPIYAIDGLRLARGCRLDDVRVAVLPGRERPILGLSALRRLAPLEFTVDPPALRSARCAG